MLHLLPPAVERAGGGDRGADAALVARMREAYDRVVAPA